MTIDRCRSFLFMLALLVVPAVARAADGPATSEDASVLDSIAASRRVTIGSEAESDRLPLRLSYFTTPLAPAVVIQRFSAEWSAQGYPVTVFAHDEEASVTAHHIREGRHRIVIARRHGAQTLCFVGATRRDRPGALAEAVPVSGAVSSEGSQRPRTAVFRTSAPLAALMNALDAAAAKERLQRVATHVEDGATVLVHEGSERRVVTVVVPSDAGHLVWQLEERGGR